MNKICGNCGRYKVNHLPSGLGACFLSDVVVRSYFCDAACDKWEAKVGPPDTTGRTWPMKPRRCKRIGYHHIYSDERGRFRHLWTPRQCRLMNILDFRYWGCDCGYIAPYGLVIFAGCKKHD